MTSTFARNILAMAITTSVAALAQTGSPAGATAVPAAPSATPAATAPAPRSTGTRVGTINIEQAIVATNEGRRDFDQLSKTLEPKQTELKTANEEIEALKKQFTNTQEKMNDDARATLQKQIETKQKSFDRSVQDAREDAQGRQNEIAQRILQKLAPVLVKYAGENGFGVIIDTSQPWPQGPVVWYGEAVDITRPVVEAYNAQSNVPAPPPGSGAAKPVVKPTTAPATKPATTTPATTPPPAKPQGKQ